MTGVRWPGLIIIISADKKQRVWGFPFIIDNQTEMARLQQGDGVGAGEDEGDGEGDGEAVAGGDQQWDWGTVRTYYVTSYWLIAHSHVWQEVTLSLVIYGNFKQQFPRTKNSSPSWKTTSIKVSNQEETAEAIVVAVQTL